MRWFPGFALALLVCSLAPARAGDVGYIDCNSHPETTQVLGKAAKTSQVVASLPCGERFTVLLYGVVFSRIETTDRKVGYIYSYLISRDGSTTSVQPSPSVQTYPLAAGAAPPSAPAKRPNAPAEPPSSSAAVQAQQPERPESRTSADPPSPSVPRGKSRVYITDSQSWEVSGGFGASNGTAAGSFSGGARPQTVEVIKNFMEKCPDVVVTRNKANANYIVLFDREGGKKGINSTWGVFGFAQKVNKIAIFRSDGDAVFSESARSVGGAVADACRAIAEDTKPR